MTGRLLLTVAATLSAAMLASCEKDTDTLFSNQEDKIASYVSSYLEDTTKRAVYNGGSVRLVAAEGSGLDSLGASGKATINYAGYVFSGSVSKSGLFATNMAEVGLEASWDLSDSTAFTPVQVDMRDKGLVTGLRNGLLGMKAGEEAIILFSGKYGFGKRPLGTIPANSALAYHVWVVSLDE